MNFMKSNEPGFRKARLPENGMQLTGLLIPALLTCLATLPSAANADKVQIETRVLTVEEMGSTYFAPRTPAENTRLTRSFKPRAIVLDEEASARPKPNTKTSAEGEKTLALLINFKFGKAEMLTDSIDNLDTLGRLLSRPEYANETLMIEGHTDAIGNDAYNLQLSEMRALAVRRYLVSRYNIDETRLHPVGRGESSLYDKRNPKAPINRRVQFKRL